MPAEDRSAATQARMRAWVANGGKVLGYAGTPFPEELAQALDLLPVSVLDLDPARDEHIEAQWIDDKEDPDTRSVFVRAMGGGMADFDALVCTRVLDHAHYYLREALRLGAWADPIPLHLFDLMPVRGEGVATYNRRSMQQLATFLERIAGKPLMEAALRTAIADGNKARAERRALLDRRAQGAISGTSALAALLGDDQPETPAAPGPRLMLVTSLPLIDTDLHAAVEAEGWTVVAEEDGSARINPGADIVPGDSPLDALADYYASVPTALSHPREDRTAFLDEQIASGHVDAVLFCMHPRDGRLGWDFPPLRDRIEAAGVPVAAARADARKSEGLQQIRSAANGLKARVMGKAA